MLDGGVVYINWAVRQAQEMAAARGGLLPWQVHDADADVADSSTDRSDTFIKISTDRRGKQALLNAAAHQVDQRVRSPVRAAPKATQRCACGC